MSSMTTKLLGAVLGVTFFGVIGLAMANASPTHASLAKSEMTKTEKVAVLVGVCQVRRCV